MNELTNQKILPLDTTNHIDELVERFSEMQIELKDSMDNVDEIASKDIETGFWSGVTGKTDAAISAQVKGLGLNLRTTQKVVMFLMELSHAKNEVLRGFYDTLVKKIIEIDKENEGIVGDLSVSQKNEHKIVHQIKDQIESRLAIEDNIENNKEQINSNKTHLSNLSEELEQKSELDDEQSDTLSAHQNSINDLSNRLTNVENTLDNTNYPSKMLINIYGVASFTALSLVVISLLK